MKKHSRIRVYSIRGAKREKYLEILDLINAGHNQYQIHKITNINRKTIRRIYNEYIEIKALEELKQKEQKITNT